MQLIANRWYVVLSSEEVPRARAVGHRRLGQDLVSWRDARGQVQVALDRCPHRGARLSLGRVVDGCLECPFHGFRFDSRGACVAIPAHPDRPISDAMSLIPLPSREAHGFVWVWTGPEPPDEAPIPFFDFSGHTWAGSGFVEPVATSYTRAIENQLDFPHLPFVHRSSIGRLVDASMEIHTEAGGDRIRFGLDGEQPNIEFLGPCIWRNRTGPLWQFLAFVPVDEDQMLYYVRTYQRLITLPGLRWLLGRLNATLNRIVLRQDSAVVESQPTAETRLRMGEVLVRSDGPIIAYRRWRESHRAPFEPGARARSRREDHPTTDPDRPGAGPAPHTADP